MKHPLCCSAWILSAFLTMFPAASSAASEEAPVPNFEMVTANLWRGSAPDKDGLGQLAKLGAHTIVDLRLHKNHAEESAAASLGLRYVHLPLGYWAPSRDSITKFFVLIGEPGAGTVFIHCRQGADRTGVLVAIYRRIVQHWSFEQAYAEMKTHHFKSWLFALKERVEDYQPEVPVEIEATAVTPNKVSKVEPR